jgi:hypothetical protein
VDADSDAGDLLPIIVALLDLRGGRDRRLLRLDVADSSSRPGVAGAACLPALAGGASFSPFGFEGSSSRPGVAGAACLPLLAGGASLSPLGAGAREPCAGDAGARLALLDLEDMASFQEVDGRCLLGVGA